MPFKENKELLWDFTKVFSAPVALTAGGPKPEYGYVNPPDEVRQIAGLLSYPGFRPQESLRFLASHRAELARLKEWPLSPQFGEVSILRKATLNLDDLTPDQAERISRIISSGTLAPLRVIETAIERTRKAISAQNKNPLLDEPFIQKLDLKIQITQFCDRLERKAAFSGREN